MDIRKNYNLVSHEPASGRKRRAPKTETGFSMVELIVSTVLSVMILGVAVTAFMSAMTSRTREASRTDAITSTQAALNILSREIGNSGYGLTTNGIVTNDSTAKKLHIRTNTGNSDGTTSAAGEDVTFYYDAGSQSVVRYDAFNGGTISGVINRVSDVDFTYYNYDTVTGAATAGSAAANTGRVSIRLTVTLADIKGQPSGQKVLVTSDVTLRNSPVMLGQY